MSSATSSPKSWRPSRLQDLVFLQRGYDITKAEQNPGQIPVVSSSGIGSYHTESRADGPGVLIGRKGSIGTLHYVDSAYWPHDTTLWSKDFMGNHPLFVYYFLHTLNLKRYDTGNSNPTLNRNHIHGIRVGIPDYDVQERIASRLTVYDQHIENNQRRIRLLERVVRGLYREWFVRLRFPGYESTRTIDGVPEGWQRKKIREVCMTSGGGTPSTKRAEYWNGDITWVVPTDVTKNDCLALLDSARKITEKGLRESSAKMVPAETILMTSRASVGFFAMMDREVCTNQGFINIVPHDEELRLYLLFNLIERVPEIRSNAQGTTYPEISKGRFREMDVVIPKKEIAIEYSGKASAVIRQVRCLKRQVSALTEARDLLLPRLMNGEITV